MTNTNCNLKMVMSDKTLTVELLGEIDHHSAVEIRAKIDEEIIKNEPQKTVFELAGISFMDSSGLGLIMGRYALMKKIGGELVLSNPAESVVRIFELAGLGRIVKIENIKQNEGLAEPQAPRKKSKKHKRR